MRWSGSRRTPTSDASSPLGRKETTLTRLMKALVLVLADPILSLESSGGHGLIRHLLPSIDSLSTENRVEMPVLRLAGKT